MADTANIVGISSGYDNGIPVILASAAANPLDNSNVIYQFSAGRGSVDSVPNGTVTIPFAGGVLVQHRDDFPPEFPSNQAADIFDNRVVLGRWNWPMVFHNWMKLVGQPAPVIDNIDAFKSVGSFPGGYDADNNGQLDEGKRIYAVFDSMTAGFDTATIYVNTGTNTPGGAGWMPYATPVQLGLQPGDKIDAISIWDVEPFGVFSPGDGVVFSLEAGSPTITSPFIFPGDPFAVPIDQGGIFLAVPGMGIVAGLPGQYFGLQPGDELDEIYAIDPRLGETGCGSNGGAVRPMDAVVLSPSRLEVPVDGIAAFSVALNDAARGIPDPGGLIQWSVTATADNVAIQSFTGAICQPPVPQMCTASCSTLPPIPGLPPCNGGTDTAAGANFGTIYGQNVCLVHQLLVKGVTPGVGRLRISAAPMTGTTGAISTRDLHAPDDDAVTSYAEAIIVVTP